MPPRSVLLNVFTTARGLDKPTVKESVREAKVQGEEENGNSTSAGTKGATIEGRDKSMHIKHDSTQSSPDDSIAIGAAYSGFTTPTAHSGTPPSTEDGPSNLNVSQESATPSEPTGPVDLTLDSKSSKPARTCDNCGYTPTPSDATLKQCSRCKLTLYCSAKCQKSNWPMHKKACAQKKADALPISNIKIASVSDTPAEQDARSKDSEYSPDVSGASTPVSPFEDGMTSTAATSPGLYFEDKSDLLDASIPLA